MLNHAVISVWVLFYLTSPSECMRNNVCKTLEDYRTVQNNPNCWHNPDIGASPEKIAHNYGFPFESHKLKTEDGYILTIFRIPHNGSDTNRKRPPVLLQHGILVDGTTWMSEGPESLVFYLSNKGYDVWISNTRGNKYSYQHVNYTVYNPYYWDFSWHEMGVYDVPTMIDFIASKTGQNGDITYIGHSMGSTMSYVYASLKPDHAKNNLRSIISLAPVVYMDHVGPIPKTFAPLRFQIWNLFASLGIYGIGPNIQFKIDLFHSLCTQYPFIILCANGLQLLTGSNDEETRTDAYPQFFSSAPSGMSLKTLFHYGQIIDNMQGFQMMDYGPEANLKLYNTRKVPEYPLERVNVPVHIFHGTRDLLSNEVDAHRLFDKLETEKTFTEVSDFVHFNFLSSKHPERFHEMLLPFLEKSANDNMIDDN